MLQKAPAIPDQQDLQEKEYQPESPKPSQSSIGGLLYYKNKCVWWMKGSDKKNPAQKTGQLCEYKLFRHGENLKDTVNIKDEFFVETVSALLHPFADDDLMYHFLIFHVVKTV